MTEKMVMINGDLHAQVTILSSEFGPDLIGGTLHGPVLAPPYLAPDLHAAPVAPESVLVPEVLRTEGEDDSDELRHFDTPDVHGGRLLERIKAGLPVTLAGLRG